MCVLTTSYKNHTLYTKSFRPYFKALGIKLQDDNIWKNILYHMHDRGAMAIIEKEKDGETMRRIFSKGYYRGRMRFVKWNLIFIVITTNI